MAKPMLVSLPLVLLLLDYWPLGRWKALEEDHPRAAAGSLRSSASTRTRSMLKSSSPQSCARRGATRKCSHTTPRSYGSWASRRPSSSAGVQPRPRDRAAGGSVVAPGEGLRSIISLQRNTTTRGDRPPLWGHASRSHSEHARRRSSRGPSRRSTGPRWSARAGWGRRAFSSGLEYAHVTLFPWPRRKIGNCPRRAETVPSASAEVPGCTRNMKSRPTTSIWPKTI